VGDLPGESGGSAGRRPILRVSRHDASVLGVRGYNLLPNSRESAEDNHSSTSCTKDRKKNTLLGHSLAIWCTQSLDCILTAKRVEHVMDVTLHILIVIIFSTTVEFSSN